MSPTDETSDRGQMLVIMGLLIAVMLVALALVLNAAIFTENLSTRETTDSEEPSSYAADTGSTVADVYNRTNDNDTRKAVYAKTSFNESLETWADSRSDTAAENGALFEADWTTHAGWRLEQDENRSFTPANNDSATAWTVADGVQNISAFELNVNRTKLYDNADTGAFRLNISDGTTDWKLYVYQNSTTGKINVSKGNPTNSSSEKCSQTADRAVIDLRNENLTNNSTCDALNFSSAVSGPLVIRYENVNVSGDERVNGTYTLVVNGSDAVDTARFNDPGPDPPTATAVVYAVRYDTRYQRKEVVHDVEGWHSPRAETYQPS
ncbi:hypothetical protein BRD14_08600 [Halobacteriales archaeon SW_5_68_122]|nr:MAG: hypothetical protein BRD14_08600 [Halobacteriales archaeon SW_5_68_122]